MNQFSCSDTFPRTSSATAAGTNVIDRTAAAPSANSTVIAIGVNILPSTPASVRIGR